MLTVMLVSDCKYKGGEMAQKKTVAKGRKAAGKVKRMEAQAGRGGAAAGRPGTLPEELSGMYKVVKKPVTLRLDADVLAWFQRGGRGYQTRINEALREVVSGERKAKKG
jgi:uncharacterized protein (DUF4415 family)